MALTYTKSSTTFRTRDTGVSSGKPILHDKVLMHPRDMLTHIPRLRELLPAQYAFTRPFSGVPAAMLREVRHHIAALGAAMQLRILVNFCMPYKRALGDKLLRAPFALEAFLRAAGTLSVFVELSPTGKESSASGISLCFFLNR